jgi:hypothetical protein
MVSGGRNDQEELASNPAFNDNSNKELMALTVVKVNMQASRQLRKMTNKNRKNVQNFQVFKGSDQREKRGVWSNINTKYLVWRCGDGRSFVL